MEWGCREDVTEDAGKEERKKKGQIKREIIVQQIQKKNTSFGLFTSCDHLPPDRYQICIVTLRVNSDRHVAAGSF